MTLFLVVVAFLAAWTALYFLVIRPKLAAFRYTAGIYAQLDAFEHGLWDKAGLWLRGLKVAIIGFVTSSAPIAAVAWDKMGGLDWAQLVSSERAKTIAAVVTILGVLGPMIMVALHNNALAEAAATEPQK